MSQPKLRSGSLAKGILELNDEIADLDELIEKLVKELAGPLLELPGMGIESAGEFLVAAGDNPERLGLKASFSDDVWSLSHPCILG
jgi:transposase